MKLRNKMLWAGCLGWLVGISQICAQDYPASPFGKEGYRLIFHDEFDGKEIQMREISVSAVDEGQRLDKYPVPNGFRNICLPGLRTEVSVHLRMK
jgi:hypothetical protein